MLCWDGSSIEANAHEAIVVSSAFANTYDIRQGCGPCRTNVTPESWAVRQGTERDSAVQEPRGERGRQRWAGEQSLEEVTSVLGPKGWET